MSRLLRRIGVATLLTGAVLTLSGCWANVHNWGDGTRNITLTQAISDRIIFSCTAEHGDQGAGRALCALDTVGALCHGIHISGLSDSGCNHISSYSDWQGMEYGIEHVTGSDDCLSFFWNSGGYPDDFWGSVQKGFASCK